MVVLGCRYTIYNYWPSSLMLERRNMTCRWQKARGNVLRPNMKNIWSSTNTAVQRRVVDKVRDIEHGRRFRSVPPTVWPCSLLDCPQADFSLQTTQPHQALRCPLCLPRQPHMRQKCRRKPSVASAMLQASHHLSPWSLGRSP